MSLDRGQRNEASLTAGVFVYGLNPSGGGAAAFATTLIEAITGTEQKHKFILLILARFSGNDSDSSELLYYGNHVLIDKR